MKVTWFGKISNMCIILPKKKEGGGQTNPKTTKNPKLGTFWHMLMCKGKKAERFLWNFEGEDC